MTTRKIRCNCKNRDNTVVITGEETFQQIRIHSGYCFDVWRAIKARPMLTGHQITLGREFLEEYTSLRFEETFGRRWAVEGWQMDHRRTYDSEAQAVEAGLRLVIRVANAKIAEAKS